MTWHLGHMLWYVVDHITTHYRSLTSCARNANLSESFLWTLSKGQPCHASSALDLGAGRRATEEVRSCWPLLIRWLMRIVHVSQSHDFNSKLTWSCCISSAELLNVLLGINRAITSCSSLHVSVNLAILACSITSVEDIVHTTPVIATPVSSKEARSSWTGQISYKVSVHVYDVYSHDI